MIVRATDKYEKLNIQDNELGKIPKAGEEWEVSVKRYEVLKGNNSYKVAFVEAVKEEVETATKKVKTEKAVKKTTKKEK